MKQFDDDGKNSSCIRMRMCECIGFETMMYTYMYVPTDIIVFELVSSPILKYVRKKKKRKNMTNILTETAYSNHLHIQSDLRLLTHIRITIHICARHIHSNPFQNSLHTGLFMPMHSYMCVCVLRIVSEFAALSKLLTFRAKSV